MLSGFFAESIVKRAQAKKAVEINLVNIRDFAIDSYGTVDDKPYGGGAGMVMRVDVVYQAIAKVKSQMLKVNTESQNSKIILTAPKGKQFNQEKAQEYAKLDELIIIAGHYEEIDERVRDYIDEEVSLGDFVMTGGEITAAAIADSVVRLLPGVLKKNDATQMESFMIVSIKRLIESIGENDVLLKLTKKGINNIRLLEYPQYTRPEEFKGKKVPDILLSGDHKKIEIWKLKKAFAETLKKRPDLLT